MLSGGRELIRAENSSIGKLYKIPQYKIDISSKVIKIKKEDNKKVKNS